MTKPVLKNIIPQEVQVLKDMVQVQQGQVVSKTLVQNKGVGITLFAFDKGEEIAAHDSKGDAMIVVLEGTGCFTVGGTDYRVSTGETLVMPATVPHAVAAPEAFKMLLTVVFPPEEKKEMR